MRYLNRVFSLAFLLTLISTFLLATPSSAQGSVTTCLPGWDNLYYAYQYPVTAEAQAILARWSGPGIWLGYAENQPRQGQHQSAHWDMPDDVAVSFMILGMDAGQWDDRLILVYSSVSTPDVQYVMVFDQPAFDIQGHFGHHPCGHAVVPTPEISAFLTEMERVQ